MGTVTIDPVSRIEGHLKIQMNLEDIAGTGAITPWQRVKKVASDGTNGGARSSGTMFRGFEIFLNGRDPRDAWMITQRICGVCPAPHGMASNLALDQAFGVEDSLPTAGVLIRNILHGAYYLYDHVLHFYILMGPELGVLGKYPPMVPPALGTKGISAIGLGSSYAAAVTTQRLASEIVALWGGKFPHHMTQYPGGVSAQPTADRLAATFARMVPLWEFVALTMYPDFMNVVNKNTTIGNAVNSLIGAGMPVGLDQIGVGTGNFLSYGIFPDYTNYGDWLDPKNGRRDSLVKSGAWTNGGPAVFDPKLILEDVKYSWYSSGTELNPTVGETVPIKPADQASVKPDAYSWLKAPRYNDKVYEVGPLARMINTWGTTWSGSAFNRVHPVTGYDYGPVSWKVLNPNGSVVDRVAGRVYLSLAIANKMFEWIAALKSYMNTPIVNNVSVPNTGSGLGLWDAPRGALLHYLEISGKKISKYQCVVPGTWLFSPRDDKDRLGIAEYALSCGTTWLPKNLRVSDVADAIYPAADVNLSAWGAGTVTWGNALKTALAPHNLVDLNMEPAPVTSGVDSYNTSLALAIVRSFDPCLACAVHIITPEGKRLITRL
jgi:hydrogenase large subunit